MKKVFNLKQAFMKTAFYDDARGYVLRNSRCWPNCVKQQMDGEKKSKHEAYMECIKQYNSMDRSKWLESYTGAYAENIKDRTDKPTKGSKGLQIDKDNK